jgi:hypothetical protein
MFWVEVARSSCGEGGSCVVAGEVVAVLAGGGGGGLEGQQVSKDLFLPFGGN